MGGKSKLETRSPMEQSSSRNYMKIIESESKLIIKMFDRKAMLFWLILGGSFIFLGSLFTIDRPSQLKFLVTFGFRFAFLAYGSVFLLLPLIGLFFRCNVKLGSIYAPLPLPYLRLEWKAQNEQIIIKIQRNFMKLGWILIIARKDGNLKMPFFLKKDAMNLAEEIMRYYGDKCEIQK